MGHIDTEELRDNLIAELARKHAGATRTLIITGNEKVLHDMANAVGDHLSEPGVCERLVRTALATGPITTGQMFTDLLTKCIADDAELEAIKEAERMEAFGRADPARCKPRTGAIAQFARGH